ncbi:MAG TPA: ABC transporter permease [Bryobacteraceae bacterium]|nr:ABC transporter permease [Bryobacteraceae bacterium]
MSMWPFSSRRPRGQELDEEIRAHLAMATRDRIERGEEPRTAERAARREFGNRTLIEEAVRETWGWNSLETAWQDARYAVRALRRNPGFTAVAILSLALGIGANTAIFSLVNTLMLRPLPVQHPEQLVEPLHRLQDEPHFNSFSWRNYRYFLDHNHVFSALTAMSGIHYDFGAFFNVRDQGPETERVSGVCVTGNYFPMLGVKPALGRLFGPEDDRLNAPEAVAVVSWPYWKDRFNLDSAILGRRIVVDGSPVTIAGVTARSFRGVIIDYPQDIWLPLAMLPVLAPGRSVEKNDGIMLVGRLKPGVRMEQARAEMAVLFRQAVAEEPNSRAKVFLSAMQFEMESAAAGLSRARDQFARPLLLLMGVVALLLLLACANVAGMLAARGAARHREMALRVSLGAGGWRMARQALTESLLLSGSGTLLGVGLAYAGAAALLKIVASGRERLEIHPVPDAHVLLFTAGLALLTGLLFGMWPALRAWRTAPALSLREPGKGGDTRFRRLFGRSLVAAQVALSVGLLSVAGLFILHLSNIYAGLGFQRDHVLLATLDPSRTGYSRPQLARPYQEILERLQKIPQVRSATLSGVTPTLGAGANRDATVEGYQDRPGELRYLMENWVGPKYFETFGTPLLRGRDFTFQDQGGPRVAIVNQAMARYYFGDGNPLGKHVTFDDDPKPYEIVGVAGDAKYIDAREITPHTIYFNAFQEGHVFSRFSLRTRGAPASVVGDFRRIVNGALKNATVERITTLADQVDAGIVPERLIVTLSGLFGALGALLAAIGAYGLLAYSVARRTNEIGICMALGATQSRIARMVLGESLGTTCAGLAIGAPLAYLARRTAVSLVPGLPVKGAPVIALSAVMMLVIALIAAYIPARRATRVDPMEALRCE